MSSPEAYRASTPRERLALALSRQEAVAPAAKNRLRYTPEQLAARRAALAKTRAKKLARRKHLPRITVELPEQRNRSLYGSAPREGLPAAPAPPPVGSPQERTSRLRSLLRERDLIQRSIDALYASLATS